MGVRIVGKGEVVEVPELNLLRPGQTKGGGMRRTMCSFGVTVELGR
jgi:hypothetical protein